MRVEITQAAPLTAEEKKPFLPDLAARGLSPVMLDIMPNIPHRTSIVRVYTDDGKLAGLSSVILTPNLFMKHCYGQGNHIGTNNTFFFAQVADRAAVLKAILTKLLEMRPSGHYVGLIDDELAEDFASVLGRVPHVVADKVMQAGSIATRGGAERLLKEHAHLSRQLNRFRNHGGAVRVIEGMVEETLARSFVACCLDSYRKNTHPGMPIDVECYSEHVLKFLTSTSGLVHIYASLSGQVVGVQSFIRHARHLELTEGGFLSQTMHAYENIIVESVRWALAQGLERVSYGLILNPNKERLTDADTRKPVYLIMFSREPLPAMASEQMRLHAHERFPMLVWKERFCFSGRLLESPALTHDHDGEPTLPAGHPHHAGVGREAFGHKGRHPGGVGHFHGTETPV